MPINVLNSQSGIFSSAPVKSPVTGPPPSPRGPPVNLHANPFLYSIGDGGVQSRREKSLRSCQALCNPVDYSLPGSSVCGISQVRTLEWVAISFSAIFQSLLKFMSVESMLLSNHLIPCHPLLPLPAILPSIRVFSNVSALHNSWPKC